MAVTQVNKVRRIIIGVVIGIAVGLLTGWVTRLWEYAPLAGWDAMAVVMLGVLWVDFHRHNATRTAAIVRQDNMGHSIVDVILMLAALASIVAVGLMLAGATSTAVSVAFGLGSIVISWALVHALYAVRYAVMYYDSHDDGIDFSSKEKPAFIDFAYVAYTVGMTYQVSDTTFTSTRFRRAALHHALLSFVFGVAIIAVSINFVASLGQ